MESMGCEATCREEATRSARTSAGGASVLWRVLSCRRGIFRTRWHEAELRQCPTNLAGNLQMIDYLLNTPFVIPVAVVFAAGFLNRRQEVDKHGDPTLRLRGPFLVLFAIAMWFSSVALANLGNPSEKFSILLAGSSLLPWLLLCIQQTNYSTSRHDRGSLHFSLSGEILPDHSRIVGS